jgi:hypothetical protein
MFIAGIEIKRLIALLVCFSGMAGAQQPNQIVPASILSAKTIMPVVYYPNGKPADVNEVRWEADRFLTKWHRFAVTYDAATADIVVRVVVEPLTVYPGFWQHLAWGMAASQAGTRCSAQSYGSTATANCYTTPTPAPLMPGVVLNGSILLFDGNEVRDWMAGRAGEPTPILTALADGRGSRPLIGAGKKLRKMIDEASKVKPQ